MKATTVIGVLVAVGACGGVAVIDPPGGAGGDGGSTSTSTAACDAHDDCPGGVCLFASGRCATSCNGGLDSCGQGEVCDACATSSCPTCADCLGACVPAQPGACDDHDDCASDEVCLYSSLRCAPACESFGCADPNLVCEPCATSSCPGCDDCLGACLASF